jgi:hypothetical protein
MAHAFPLTDVSDEAVAIINEVLKRRLARFGFTRAEIRPGEDHDGDPVIFAEVRYKRTDDPIDSRETAAAQSEIWRRLMTIGEYRFPHVRHHFAKGQPIRGYP